MILKISIASDHAGFDIKNRIISEFDNKHLENFKEQFHFVDCGCYSEESTDYPDYAERVAINIYNNISKYGILVCGSGIGMAIAANRFPFIRAVNTINLTQVELSRQHNNANILCLGARLSTFEEIKAMIIKFFSTEFLGLRHLNRVNKLSKNFLKHYAEE
jgi:RpiB/LacA/LacB family sugar-phosphate isomerase